jgi:cytoskeletal protein RodZ
MRFRLVIAAAVAPFLLAACGGSDDNSADDSSTPTSSSATPSDATSSSAPTDSTEPTDSTTSAAPADDEAAIEQTLTDFLLAPRCDLATDDYLIKRSLFGDSNAKKACQELEDTFIQPQFTADDIVYSDLKITGDTATVEVGSKLINITTKYQLTKVDGTWLVSGDEYNSDL